MSKTGGLSCFFLILAAVGSVPSSDPARTGPLKPSSDRRTNQRSVPPRLTEAYRLLQDGKYLQAQELYRAVYEEARAQGATERAGRCLTAIGNCLFATFRYREALKNYVDARAFAEAAGDWANLGSLNVNISGLLLQMGDLDAAAHSAEEARADFKREDFAGGSSRCLIQLAVIRARQGRMEESAALVHEAVDSAYRDGDLAAVAQAWDHLGEEYLTRGQLAEAEAALTEAFRLRKLHHLSKLDSSYLNLGRLRLAQGDLRSASRLLDEAIGRQANPDSLTTVWSLYHARGQARLAEGSTGGAFADFQKALTLVRQWRLEVLPADFTRISSEVQLQQIYASFIEVANRLAARRPELASESFRATEENRAASLHALLSEPDNWRDALPAEYWATLAELHGVEVSLLHTDDSKLQERMQQLRTTLMVLEAKAGSNGELDTDRLRERTQRNLPPNAVLLSFHLGERQSFLWAVSRERFRVYRLSGKAELTADIARFADAVRTGDARAASLGYELYRRLFGQLSLPFRDKPQWILALDEELFRIPFGALVVDRAGPVYLAGRHSIRITTGAVSLAAGHQLGWHQILSGSFLGVGDPIYNTADPRWNNPPGGQSEILAGVAYAASAPERLRPALARLAGSAREIESCARIWDPRPGSAILLEGSDASPARLREALRTDPSVVHIAAHFLEAHVPPRHSLIALSLAGPGDPQLLSPLEITRSRVHAGIVVLSGCSSGRAEVLPASGLMGLTRAWLAGGARAVVASHWPTPDDSGALFVRFYEHFRQAPDAGPAVALQGAQRDVLRAGGWRSNPQYWATYFVIGDQ